MVPHDTLITDYKGHHDLMSQEQEMVKYAKVNSDNSRCFGIDDVPSKGPNKEISRHPLIVSEFSPDIAKRARKLIEDDQISICRETGIRFTKNSPVKG